jgi:FkbM family methyltransferase
MKRFWDFYRSVKHLVPRPLVQKSRCWMEAHLDFLWQKKSYSQFGEDIILPSLIGRRKIGKGFYVDIGAFAPKQFSNTYLLYQQGWRGINIDATPGAMKVFKAARKRDINLEVAVSSKEQDLVFYSWGAPTVTNTLSKTHAEHYTKIIGRPPVEVTVHAEPLAAILDRYRQHFTAIDVMNIDVENHTMEVLQSNDWGKYSPAILIIEIEGASVDDILASQEHAFLTSKGYRMCGWTNPSVFYELG